jgi:hypothetical protein
VALGIRPAGSVVAHFEGEDAGVDRSPHRRPRRPGMLHDVGQRLGDDEVRAGLHVPRQPLAQDVDIDRKVQSRHERVDAGAQPAAGQRRGQDPVRQLAQLVRCPLRGTERLRQQRLRVAPVLVERLLRELERDDRVHEPLLGAVVQVADDVSARFVARDEHAGA